MATKHDVPHNVLIEKVAEELKNVEAIQPPAWAKFVKTGSFKERVPQNPDWWYMRAASVLRKLSLKGPIGVSKLRVNYGGRKNRGVRPEQFRKASGNIIRKVLQQLEKAGLAQQKTVGKHYGRVATAKGHSVLDKTAHALAKVLKKTEMQPIVVDIKKVKKSITVAPPKKKAYIPRGPPRGGRRPGGGSGGSGGGGGGRGRPTKGRSGKR